MYRTGVKNFGNNLAIDYNLLWGVACLKFNLPLMGGP